MPNLDKVIDELHYVTERLSARSRTLSGGVLALSWVFLLANTTGGEEKDVLGTGALLPPIALSLGALVADLAQYWFGYLHTKKHLKHMQREKLDEARYDYRQRTFRLRMVSFYAKLVLSLAGVVWFLVILTVRMSAGV